MLDRIKQDMTACREIASFLRRRAQLEDDYGRNSVKLARSAQEAYRDSDGKAGSFVTAFTAALRSHELLGENRMRFAQQLVEMADQLGELQRESDRARKANKELGARLEKTLADSESSTEKARMRFDAAHDELEKVLVMKAGESSRDSANTPFIASHATLSSSPTQSFATSSGGIGSAPSSSSSTSKQRTFGKAMSRIKLSGSSTPRNPAQLARLEEEARARCARESDAYAKESAATSEHRSNHFRREMPRVLRALKESADEIDLGTQYHLARYAHLYEHVLVQDGLLVSPVGSVDDRASFKSVDDLTHRSRISGVESVGRGHRQPRGLPRLRLELRRRVRPVRHQAVETGRRHVAGVCAIGQDAPQLVERTVELVAGQENVRHRPRAADGARRG